jgi:hypothetical protein
MDSHLRPKYDLNSDVLNMKRVAAIFLGLSLMIQDNFKTSTIQVISKSVLTVTCNTQNYQIVLAVLCSEHNMIFRRKPVASPPFNRMKVTYFFVFLFLFLPSIL